MPTTNILNANLSGQTVIYNGVQFGGADTLSITAITGGNPAISFEATPPMYELQQNFRYDKSRANIIGIDNTLTVRSWVYQNSASVLGDNMSALRKLLGQPGKRLEIAGLGLGLDYVSYDSSGTTPSTHVDLDNGPRPVSISLVPISDICFELTWVVQFFTSECFNVETTDEKTWVAFSYSTTWANDFEGITTRSITGSVKIPQIRDLTNPAIRRQVADEIRNRITITVPPNFRRIHDTWNESEDKSELTFHITDQYLPGDDLPTGMTMAQGELQFSSQGGPNGASMSQGIVTMNMVLKSSPYVARALAGRYFIVAAICKQRQLTTDPISGKPRTHPNGGSVVVIPMHFAMSNQKFDNCRVTSGSISWLVQNNFWDNLNSCNLFEGFNQTVTSPPFGNSFGNQDYAAWREAMNPLWNNRGVSGIGSDRNDAAYLNLCSNIDEKTIGNTGSVPRPVLENNLPTLVCPPLPTDADGKVLPTAGWLHYRIEVELKRVEHNIAQRKAIVIDQMSTPDLVAGNAPGPKVYFTDETVHVSERQGLPDCYIAVKYAGLRYGEQPIFPGIKSYGGILINDDEDYVGGEFTPASLAFEVFGCKVYKMRGYVIYRLRGVPDKPKTYVGSVTEWSTPLDPSQPIEL